MGCAAAIALLGGEAAAPAVWQVRAYAPACCDFVLLRALPRMAPTAAEPTEPPAGPQPYKRTIVPYSPFCSGYPEVNGRFGSRSFPVATHDGPKNHGPKNHGPKNHGPKSQGQRRSATRRSANRTVLRQVQSGRSGCL